MWIKRKFVKRHNKVDYSRGVKINLVYMVSDFVCGIVATTLAGVITSSNIFGIYSYYWVMCIMFSILCILCNKSKKLYNINFLFYTDRIISYITKTFLYITMVVSSLLFYVGRSNIEMDFYVAFLVCQYILLLLSAFLGRQIVKKIKSVAPRTILLGNKEGYTKFLKYVHKSNMKLNIIGYVSLHEEEGYLGKLEDLEHILHSSAIDQVYILEQKSLEVDIGTYINVCMEIGVTVGIIMGLYPLTDVHRYTTSIGTYPVVTYHTVVLNKVSRVVKRLIDIVGSLVGIVLSLPFLLVAAVAIKAEDFKGPVIFKQLRVGQNGRQFYIYKFRSMCTDAESKKKELMEKNEMGSDFMFKIKEDPRVTKVGRVLRRTNIDELPQFLNVLFGDMSLVGTRPPTVEEVKNYQRWHWRRVSIKPGITGMWQVSGRSQITDFDEVVELDTEYIDKWSIMLDIKILFKTGIQMVWRNNDAF